MSFVTTCSTTFPNFVIHLLTRAHSPRHHLFPPPSRSHHHPDTAMAPTILTAEQEDQYMLITRNLAETLGSDIIKNSLIAKGTLDLYWGTATTGKPHVGYLVPLGKIADFLKAKCRVKVLLADVHGYLDNQKAPWELLAHRTRYYSEVIRATLKSIGVPLDRLEFVTGSSYQLERNYTLDVYKLAANSSEHDFRKAGAEVVKQTEHPPLSGLLYPGLQALDEEYLKVDAQFGGVDQRKIFTFAEKVLPNIGYKKRAHLMNIMVPGLMGDKMSSSDPDSKIDLLEDPKMVERKLKKAFCEEGNIEKNGVLTFLKHVYIPMISLRAEGIKIVIERKEEHGGNMTFTDYASLEAAFAAKEIHPGDLKAAVTKILNEIIAPIRKEFETAEMQQLIELAYPTAVTEKKAKAPKGPAKPKVDRPTDLSRIDLKVGRILKAEKHPDADSLYIETIDFGNEDVRTVVSGLAKYVPLEDLKDRMIIGVCNLKPSSLRGVKSYAMLLCASDGEGDNRRVVTLIPPPGAKEGDRVTAEGFSEPPDEKNTKCWDVVQAELKSDGNGVGTYMGKPLCVNNEECKSVVCNGTLS